MTTAALELVDPKVQQQAPELCRQFENAEPFRHVLIDRFFDPGFCRRLAKQFPAFNERRARNELGETGRKAVHSNLKELGPDYVLFDQLLQSAEFLSLIGQITAIPDLLYDPEYIGGGTHENLHGQDLDPHIDFNYHPTTRWHRRLNLILFLNPVWKPEWGGVLELEKDPGLPRGKNIIKPVVPVENRCVIFETTEHSWHGFRRIQIPNDMVDLSRRSIAVYFYTKDRPRPQSAPNHGTVYVQRPLPEFLKPGYTLREQDVSELQTLVARRDTHIRHLYDKEREFWRIAHSPAFVMAKALTWPFRKVRDLTARNPPRSK